MGHKEEEGPEKSNHGLEDANDGQEEDKENRWWSGKDDNGT